MKAKPYIKPLLRPLTPAVGAPHPGDLQHTLDHIFDLGMVNVVSLISAINFERLGYLAKGIDVDMSQEFNTFTKSADDVDYFPE